MFSQAYEYMYLVNNLSPLGVTHNTKHGSIVSERCRSMQQNNETGWGQASLQTQSTFYLLHPPKGQQPQSITGGKLAVLSLISAPGSGVG